MLRRCAITTLFALLTLLNTGCYGSKETDDVAYILVIGVDKAGGGKEKITYQIAVPRAVSGGTDAKSSDKLWILNTIEIPTLAEARMLLKSTMSRTPKVNHITAYVFSEELAREGLGRTINYVIRSRDYRETIYLIIVPGSAEEYIKHNKPTLETTISRFYEIFLSSASEGSYFMPATFHDFYTRLKNKGASPYATYSSINLKTGNAKPAGTKTPEQKDAPYLPGGIGRTGTEDPAEFLGLAVFQGDKMVGVLNSDETRAVSILQGKSLHSYIGIVDPLQPEKDVINLEFSSESKPKISVKLNDGLPVFDIQVSIDAELLGVTSGINYEAAGYRELLEMQLANLLKGQITTMLKHTQELGVDPVGLSLYLRPKFSNTNEMEQARISDFYRTADVHISVTAKLRRTGLIWRTSPLKNQ